MPSDIKSIDAYRVFDSRGFPTIESRVTLQNGCEGFGVAPSGASTGKHEAHELRDGGKCFDGKDVSQAIHSVQDEIAPMLRGGDVFEQEAIDASMIELDGTLNKSRLGANAILSVSLAVADAAARCCQQPPHIYLGGEEACLLPVPLMNIINGGAHANNNIAIQEFMIVPSGLPKFTHAMQAGVEVYHALRAELARKNLSTAVGDEGGFAPDLPSNEAALDLLMQAIEQAGYRPGVDIHLALDVASSELLQKDGSYAIHQGKPALPATELISYYQQLCQQYPICSIEDALGEEDWDAWQALTAVLGQTVQLVGDDLFVTNMRLLHQGIKQGVANSILIKPNQIGTLTETLQCIGLAKQHKYRTIISHRSGETESSGIADLAVATQAGQIKTGAPCRSDRVSKYNQLLRIAYQLGDNAKWENPFKTAEK